MLIVTDLDGTIDAQPTLFQHLLSALRAAGDQVAVLTGIPGAQQIAAADVQAKRDYLDQLGFDAYDRLVVLPDDGELPQLKAAWCRSNGAALLIDNNRANAQACQDTCLVLLPWQTRLGKKKHGKP